MVLKVVETIKPLTSKNILRIKSSELEQRLSTSEHVLLLEGTQWLTDTRNSSSRGPTPSSHTKYNVVHRQTYRQDMHARKIKQ